MSIPIDSYCIQCHLRRNVEYARTIGTPEQTTAFTKALLKLYLSAPEDAGSPWFGPHVANLLHEMYGVDIDRFREEKAFSNRFVLERLEKIRKKIEAAEDPVFAGLQYAILGNYLDFSALQGKVSFSQLEDMLDQAQSISFSRENYDSLCRDLAAGRKLLYLTDNAGEIGFDRLLAEQIHKVYPHLEITFCVRGGIAANDATREDAAMMGIPFPIIDNGNRVGGTQLDQLSADAQQAMDEADVILAKGMGNAETMLGCGYNVYYAFLIKCERFVQIFGLPMFTPLLVRDSDHRA